MILSYIYFFILLTSQSQSVVDLPGLSLIEKRGKKEYVLYMTKVMLYNQSSGHITLWLNFLVFCTFYGLCTIISKWKQ